MAFNLDSFDIEWEYIPEQDEEVVIPHMASFPMSLGVAYVDGKIILQQNDTRLVVLNATNGKVIWSIQNGNPMMGETNINAPIIVKNMIITGNDGSEFGIRGNLTAYDIDSGRLVWRAYNTGTDDDMLINNNKWSDTNVTTVLGKPIEKNSGAKSWAFTEEYLRGGSTTEGWYSYDPELELIYYGTSSPGSWNPYHREGNNKWSNSIIARDVNTGVAKWLYQMTPHDSWANQGTNEMTLVDMNINGKIKKLLVHFDENGFVYKLDRTNGELVSADKYNQYANWADRVDLLSGKPILNNKVNPGYNGEDVVTKDICPAAVWGSSNKGMSSYHARSNLFFSYINNVCMTYEPVSYAAGGNKFEPGNAFVNANWTLYPGAAVYGGGYTHISEFIAWDPINNNIKWSIPEMSLISGGIFSTAGNIAFYGTTNGIFNAIDIQTGDLLWAYDTNSSISGSVSTWMHNSKQYIGLMVGDKDNVSEGYDGGTEGQLYIFSLDN
jgi:alcohol dehydrogenase (cytochrome c)